MKYADLSPADQANARELVRQAIVETTGAPALLSRSDLAYEAAGLDWLKNEDGTVEFCL